ncbi:MAG: DUF1998 domain-containing protein [Planctomycetaceae bacterium]|nr:DUF1998 domain-containing protein [Planctomycetaceae bacterium]
MWFPLTIASLWIPPKHLGKLGCLIEEHWNVLCEAATRDTMIGFRRVGILRAFDGFSDDAIWAAVEAKRNAAVPEGEDIRKSRVAQLKIEEWDVFTHPDADRNSRDFRLRPVVAPPGYEHYIEKVVLVERLRVVKALTGFTRIGSPGDYGDLSEVPDLHRAPLARSSPTWVPAAEVRGEGIFIQLREDAVQEWLSQPRVITRANQLNAAHIEFRRLRGILPYDDEFAVARYALIHSLSHSLIRQFSIDCGYSAASIQERIYSASGDDTNEAMAGVLLYTAAADSEGTLGGLVALGEPRTLANHLDQALERTRLCASDPLCSEHSAKADGLTLHGAACHACMFVSETSCERGNKYLDRTFLVETMTGISTPFFPND